MLLTKDDDDEDELHTQTLSLFFIMRGEDKVHECVYAWLPFM